MSVSQSINQTMGWQLKNTKAHEKLEFDQKYFTQVLMQGKHTHNLICIEVSAIKCIKWCYDMKSGINEPNHANNSKNNENMLQKECHKHYKIYIINDFILHYVEV